MNDLKFLSVGNTNSGYRPATRAAIGGSGTIADFVFTLSDEGLEHTVHKYDIVDLLINIGGLWFSVYVIVYILQKILLSRSLSNTLVPLLYRKPELFKYTYA